MKRPRVAIVSDLAKSGGTAWISSPRCCCSTSRPQTCVSVDRRSCGPRWSGDSRGSRTGPASRSQRPPIASSTGSGTIRRWLAARRDEFDVFHIVDHSYAHLVHAPPGRAHDRDVPRPRCVCGRAAGSPRGSAGRACAGASADRRSQVAARRSFASARPAETSSSRQDIVAASRVTVVPNGVHPTCSHRAGCARGS